MMNFIKIEKFIAVLGVVRAQPEMSGKLGRSEVLIDVAFVAKLSEQLKVRLPAGIHVVVHRPIRWEIDGYAIQKTGWSTSDYTSGRSLVPSYIKATKKGIAVLKAIKETKKRIEFQKRFNGWTDTVLSKYVEDLKVVNGGLDEIYETSDKN